MSDSWIRKQVPQYKGKLPKLEFSYARDGCKRISFRFQGKEYAVSFNNDQTNMALIEKKRLEIIKQHVRNKNTTR